MTRITDEAVETVCIRLYDGWRHYSELHKEDCRTHIRSALEAAFPHLEGATPAIDREVLVRLMNAHPIEVFNGSQVVCECNLTWQTSAEYRAHLADAVLALIGGAS